MLAMIIQCLKSVTERTPRSPWSPLEIGKILLAHITQSQARKYDLHATSGTYYGVRGDIYTRPE